MVGSEGDLVLTAGTGSLVVGRSLDRETRSWYNITVTVHDGKHVSEVITQAYCFVNVNAFGAVAWMQGRNILPYLTAIMAWTLRI